MRINRVEIDRVRVRLPRPLAISFHTFTHQTNYFVRLFGEGGLVGWGEGAPFKQITEDDPEEVEAEASCIDLEDLPRLREPCDFYDDVIAHLGCPTLRAAFDFAAHDLVARARGVPVWRLYAETKRFAPNAVTVFLDDDLDATKAETRRIIDAYPGLTILKIKLGGKGDVERCRTIRQACPTGLSYVLDANQGFADPDEAVRVLGEIREVLGEVLLVEEPCEKRDREKQRRVKEGLEGLRVVADESCVDEDDVRQIIRTGCAHGINIKLQKAGGITPGRRMAKAATAAGLDVMVGAMFETSLAHGASAHFAASLEEVLLTDLDMDLSLPCFYKGKLPFVDGKRLPGDDPGLGFAYDAGKLAALEGSGVIEVDEVLRLGEV